MTPFELQQPQSLREAISLLDAQDPAVRPISGGTALLLMMKAGVLRPTRLVSLAKVGMNEIQIGPGGELRLGAMTLLRTLERSELMKQGWPVITRTLRTLSNVRVRNVATLGGHLAHGDPHTDLPPLLSALGARVTIAGPAGERSLPIEEIYAGYLETTLRRNELITQVQVPPLGARRAVYLKCTTRSADDWPALGIAVVLDGSEVRLVVSAATDKPTRLLSAERILRGKTLDEKILKQAGEAAAEEVQIEGDNHGSAAYKKQLLRVYLGRAIHEARNPVH
ncbi:MAG: xanthine dehydrogenase family protein subunit M [Pseudomonadota bacterium]|nr:xanthine dehydrogenase family protein subunit M [Pseudomonadota bacterium]